MAIVVVDRLSPFSFIPQPSPLFFSSSSPSMPITFRFPSPPLFPSLLLLPGRQTRRPRTDLSANAVLVVDLLGALVDPWAPNVDSQSIASQLFAASLLPYLGFLYHLTKSNTAPKLTLFGFYFLLAFVGATGKQPNFFPLTISSSSCLCCLPRPTDIL
ncbi:hypothetical protein O6H91_05G000300 [Diphasiastrum complanatum]|uniref:Uncharacterized protein n=1 Tax=Diphasiastrum complanatum TaxID=34168 RepID=A0ACC2DJT5_DIPCM|nr:hypothetical protein O6H91_05G000300 [Diphasiastrum complanatum]